MESLFILIPLSVLAVGVAVGVFFWMNHDGQFDDDQGPAWSILLDDDRAAEQSRSDETALDAIHEVADHEAADHEASKDVHGKGRR